MLIVEEVQMGGAPAEHDEHWKAPKIIESALEYTDLTSGKKSTATTFKRDVLQQLQEVIHSMKLVTKGQTWTRSEAFKWYISLNMNFCRSRHQNRSNCYFPLRAVQVRWHPRTRLPTSCRIWADCAANWWFFLTQWQWLGCVDHLQHLDQGTCFL